MQCSSYPHNFVILLLPASLINIKEIRQGKSHKVFEKWPDDARKEDASQCLVVLYGKEFNLQALSVAGK